MSKNDLIYITTPIYYVNDRPHVGHAYTTIAADVLARHYKQAGRDVFFLTGTDEHGAKIAEAAQKAGQEPQVFVDGLVSVFQETWQKLNISYSQFIRTTDHQHEQLVGQIVQKLVESSYVEKRQYEGLYCVGCERFLKKEELLDGKCPDHHTVPVAQSEENYFFLLSKFAKQLYDKIEKNELVVEPVARRNEVLGKIKQGLDDVSISRAGVSWGIPFPGDRDQTIYVWVDALLNYYTATHMFETEKWEQHPADLHLMAKDILWFHAIIWPAMLMAVGMPLPQKVFAHGFFTIDGQKMSKTIGNVLDPIALVDKFGADAVRYALLREFPFGEDGDISEEKIAMRYEKDLANELGNLLQRVLVMCEKYDVKGAGACAAVSTVEAINEKTQSLKFSEALEDIWQLARDANISIDRYKPWTVAKEDNKQDELAEFLADLKALLCTIADLLVPYLPDTAEKMKQQLSSLEPKPLFPRLEK